MLPALGDAGRDEVGLVASSEIKYQSEGKDIVFNKNVALRSTDKPRRRQYNLMVNKHPRPHGQVIERKHTRIDRPSLSLPGNSNCF